MWLSTLQHLCVVAGNVVYVLRVIAWALDMIIVALH